VIDFHTHPVLVKEIVEKDEHLLEAIRKEFNLTYSLQPMEIFNLQLDAAHIEKAVLLPIDCLKKRGCRIFTNEQIAELCKMNSRFIGFASVDPHANEADRQLVLAIEELGLKGLKLDPGLQEFYPNDKQLAYPIYAQASKLSIPVLIHCGMSWEKAMIKYSHPMYVEDVAKDFPNLNLILAHFGWPWVLDAVVLALKYPNVYLDTSAHYLDSPKEFITFVMTKQIPITSVERSLKHKIIFGSNYPRIEIWKMAKAVKEVGLSAECNDLIFCKNANKILGDQRRKNGI